MARDMHCHPELAFEANRTSNLMAAGVESLGEKFEADFAHQVALDWVLFVERFFAH